MTMFNQLACFLQGLTMHSSLEPLLLLVAQVTYYLLLYCPDTLIPKCIHNNFPLLFDKMANHV